MAKSEQSNGDAERQYRVLLVDDHEIVRRGLRAVLQERAEIAVVGDEKEVGAALDRLRDVGVTDFDAAIVPVDDGTDARTLDYLETCL